MQPTFVTGATGFLGAHLTCALLKKGYVVTALKRPEASLHEFLYISGLYFGHDQSLVAKNLKWVEGDITDYESIVYHLNSDYWVFHCAALVSFNKKDIQKLFTTNITGTENVVNACLFKGCKKLIYASSTAAIGKSKNNTLTNEKDEWDDKEEPSHYSISKYYAELEVWRGIEEGLNAVIVNPPIILGPCNWEKGTGRFFLNAARNFPFYTAGSNAFVYVKDVANTMISLAESEITAERFLVVAENLKFQALMNLISDAFEKKRPRILVPKWLSEIAWRWYGLMSIINGKPGLITKESAKSSFKTTYYSNQKIKDTFGFEFVSIKHAVEETVEAFKKMEKKSPLIDNGDYDNKH
jgi:dihydroflavonol-4-reductase